MSKKVSYMNLLKEAISEYDTSDHLQVKGPMLDPIISWDGDSELPTYKDAASILERYYFNESKDDGVNVLDEEELQADYQNDKGDAAGPAMQHTKGAGTNQAGTSDADTIPGAEEEQEEDIAKESVSLKEDEWDDKDVPPAKEYTDESEQEVEEGLVREQDEDEEEEKEEEGEEEVEEGLEMENAIIEKLIAEMEEDEMGVMSYSDDGVVDDMEAPDEKEASGPEEDAQGAGTQQAGTGPDEGEIPDREDMHDQMVEPKEYNESEILEDTLNDIELDVLDEIEDLLEQDEEGTDEEAGAAAEEAGEEAEELDVDKEVAEAASAVPGGPSPKKVGEDWEEDQGYYSEAFKLFKEEIEDESVEDIDSDNLRV